MACRKCQGITARGTPCSRYASCRIGCKYFCWQHADNYVAKVGCPKKKTSKKKISAKKTPAKKKRSNGSSKQKGILKPSRSKSKKKKSIRFSRKVKIYNMAPYGTEDRKKYVEKPKAKPKKKTTSGRSKKK